MIRLLCMTGWGLRFGQWLCDSGRVRNLRRELALAWARNVGWQEAHRESLVFLGGVYMATLARELDPGMEPTWTAD